MRIITQLRHELHCHPELSMNEIETSRIIKQFLRQYTHFQIAERGNWFYAVKEGRSPSQKIAFRADMDALPMNENSDLSYCSVREGVSHKCGHDGHMAALLVAGIMNGYICSAVTEFLVTFAEDSDIVNLHGWSQGSFSGADWGSALTAALITGTAFLLVFLLAKPISAYQMGEAYARSMGVNIKLFRAELILLSGILSACVAAFAGPVSFVGIAVPFLVKQALGTSKPLAVIPACFLGGAVFCLACDLIARMAFSPTELNISTVTSVIGAPVVIFMLIRRHR